MWDRNRQLVGIGHIVLASCGILAATIVFVVLSLGGAISGDPLAIQVTGGVASVVAGILVLSSLPGLIGGVGVLRGSEWAKYLTVVVSVLNILAIPLGTAVGGYTLWAFFADRKSVGAQHS